MAKKLISVRIDVTKIDKARLYKGEKGTYLDAIIHLNDEKDQYENNGFIAQQITKEERAAGVRGAILGNVKTLEFKNEGAPLGNESAATAPAAPVQNTADDLPF